MQRVVHLPHRFQSDGTMNNGKIDVLEAGCSYDGGLIKRTWLHGIAIVEDDLAACCLERLDLLLGRLAAGDPARHRLGGIGETRESREKVRHYGSQPPVKPARCSPRMMCGLVRITRHTKSVRKFSTIARIGP